MYLSSAMTEVSPVFNPFEDFKALGGQSGPCRSIKITPEVRRVEALKQQQQPVTEWSAFKATLSESNLRMVKVKPVGAGRVQEDLHHVAKDWKRWGKNCACGEKMGYAASQCIGCYKAGRKQDAVAAVKKGGL